MRVGIILTQGCWYSCATLMLLILCRHGYVAKDMMWPYFLASCRCSCSSSLELDPKMFQLLPTSLKTFRPYFFIEAFDGYKMRQTKNWFKDEVNTNIPKVKSHCHITNTITPKCPSCSFNNTMVCLCISFFLVQNTYMLKFMNLHFLSNLKSKSSWDQYYQSLLHPPHFLLLAPSTPNPWNKVT